ncbi:hypothetical protein HKD37_06G017518 [Glycine soja]
MLSQLPPFGLIFVFPLLSKPSFSRSPPKLSQKNDDLKPVHRWIVEKFEYLVRNPIRNILTVGNFKIISELRGKPFALYHFNFPQKPKTVSMNRWMTMKNLMLEDTGTQRSDRM